MGRDPKYRFKRLKKFKKNIKKWSLDELEEHLFMLNMDEGLSYFDDVPYIKMLENEIKERKNNHEYEDEDSKNGIKD